MQRRLRVLEVLLALVGVCYLAYVGVALHSETRPLGYNPNCGALTVADQTLVHELRQGNASGDRFRARLAVAETSDTRSLEFRHTATHLRLQCGWLRNSGEIVEASALQYLAAGIELKPTVAPALFQVATAASASGSLGVFQRDGRFDVVETIKWALHRPTSASIGPEFEKSRDVVAAVADTVLANRKKPIKAATTFIRG